MKHALKTLCLPFLILLWLSSSLVDEAKTPYNLSDFATLPVLESGRVKPLDTVVRNKLLIIQGKQAIKEEGRDYSPMQWFLDLQRNSKKTDTQQIFLVENPHLFASISEQYYKAKYRVSQDFLHSHHQLFFPMASQASSREPEQRSPIQKEAIALQQRVILYNQLKNTVKPEQLQLIGPELRQFKQIIPVALKELNAHQKGRTFSDSKELLMVNNYFKLFRALEENAVFKPIPPSQNQHEWQSIGEAALSSLNPNTVSDTALQNWATLSDAINLENPQAFNQSLSEYIAYLKSEHDSLYRKSRIETLFNRSDLFYKAICLYGLSIILLLASPFFPKQKNNLRTIALQLCIASATLHTVGLGLRMLLQGRPPVTNLYSSAIFVGWIAVLWGIQIEKRKSDGLGSMISAIIGTVTLIIAHHLSIAGDTLEQMQAVLDSNFWLSTHVIIITIGYSAVLLAGSIASITIFQGFLTSSLNKEKERDRYQLIMKITYAALALSFIGTVLGGIWGDQSWGRFWGWDPKENGALLIVLWTAIIIHAHLGKFIKTRGLLIMAVFGNIVCSASWWGVNLLGIGLHSYGFTEKGTVWLLSFWVIQLAIMSLGAMPKQIWKSYRIQEEKPH